MKPSRRPAGCPAFSTARSLGWDFAEQALPAAFSASVGIAIGEVLVPDLSRRLRAGDGAGGARTPSTAPPEISLRSRFRAVALIDDPVPVIVGPVPARALRRDGRGSTAPRWRSTALGTIPAFNAARRCFRPLFFAAGRYRRPFRYAGGRQGRERRCLAVGLAAAESGSRACGLGAPTLAGWAMVFPASGAAARGHGRRGPGWTPRPRAAPLGGRIAAALRQNHGRGTSRPRAMSWQCPW